MASSVARRGHVAKTAGVLAALLAVTMAPTAAHADRETAKKHHEKAKAHVTAGAFGSAISEFEKAYGEFASPQYLFNIAQIYRKNLNDCPSARDYYQRFLALGPFEEPALQQAMQIAQKHHEELSQQCGNTTAAPQVDGPAVEENSDDPAPVPFEQHPRRDPAAPKNSMGHRAATHPETGSDVYDLSDAARPTSYFFGAGGGGLRYDLGDVTVPTTLTVRLDAGFHLPIPGVDSSVSVSLESSPMRWEGETQETGVAMFTPILGNFEISSQHSNLALTGALGAGVLLISGLADGNPFTKTGMATKSTVAAARLAVGADYYFSDAWMLQGALSLQFASAPDSFAEDIERVTCFGLVAGVRHHL